MNQISWPESRQGHTTVVVGPLLQTCHQRTTDGAVKARMIAIWRANRRTTLCVVGLATIEGRRSDRGSCTRRTVTRPSVHAWTSHRHADVARPLLGRPPRTVATDDASTTVEATIHQPARAGKSVTRW